MTETFSPSDDAKVAYETAERNARDLRAFWDSLDPSERIVEGSTGQPIAHPAWKMYLDAEKLAAQLRRVLEPGKPGRKPVSIVKPSPAQKLRAVK